MLCASLTYGKVRRAYGGLTARSLPSLFPQVRSPRQTVLYQRDWHSSCSFLSSRVQLPANLQNYSNKPIISSHRNEGDPQPLLLQSLYRLFPSPMSCDPAWHKVSSSPRPWVYVTKKLLWNSSVQCRVTRLATPKLWDGNLSLTDRVNRRQLKTYP